MTETRTQPASIGEGAHLVLYDGVCGLCSRLVQFVLRHDTRCVFSFASLQSAIGQAMVRKAGGDPRDLNSFYVVANYRAVDSRAFTKSDATLFVLARLGWPWKPHGSSVSSRLGCAISRMTPSHESGTGSSGATNSA